LRERRSAEEFVELFKFVKQMKVGSMAASLRPSEQTRNYHYTDVRPVQFVAKGSFGRVYLAEPTTTQDEGALPDGEVEGTSWETGIDEETGLNYFYNSATGESVWEMPEEVAAAIAAKKKAEAGGPEVFAMKCMSKDQMHEEGLVEAVMEERKILEMINRVPFIVKFYGAFQSPTTLFLLGQYFAGGDFLGVIQNQRGRPMPRDSVAFYCAEVLSGLHGLHALGIVYRDLKPENILVSAQGHLALTDFGTANLSESMNDVAGTLSYMAPEVLQAASKSGCSDGPGYGRPVDMWSLGVMMYEMLVGRLPFTTPNNDARTKYRIMTTAPAMNHISLSGPSGADAGELVGMLLERDTEERADVGTAQAHPFFTLPDPDGSGRRQPIDWQRVIDLGYEPPWVPPRKNRQRSVSPAEDAAAKKERERAELRALVEKYPEDLHIFDPEARVRSISWHIDSEVTHLSHVE
jgi:serine/threonine protein kinase